MSILPDIYGEIDPQLRNWAYLQFILCRRRKLANLKVSKKTLCGCASLGLRLSFPYVSRLLFQLIVYLCQDLAQVKLG